MKKILLLLVFVFLTGCAVDKCNDYVVAYDCTEKYGTDCRKHYLDMAKQCEEECSCNYVK